MASSITYRIQSFVKRYQYGQLSRNNRERTYAPLIEHNIPESYIVNSNDLGHIYDYEIGSYIIHRYLYIKEDQFKKISNNIIWPSEKCSITKNTDYLGAIIYRINYNEKDWDILCWLRQPRSSDKIELIPCNYIDDGKQYSRYYSMDELPNRKVKIFFTRKEWEDDQNQKQIERIAKCKESNDKRKEVTAGAPTFSFTTPKFKITNIVKKTDWIKDAKEGDIIYGELPIIKTDNNGIAKGCLYGGMSNSNYIKVYLNDVHIRTISPITFQDLFLNNYKVEEVK